jgi:hypothetical protein
MNDYWDIEVSTEVSGGLSSTANRIRRIRSCAYNEYLGESVYLGHQRNDAIKHAFEILKTKWLEETAFTSNSYEILNNPHYLRILNLGLEIVPILLDEIQTGNNYWLHALQTITGLNPVAQEPWGRLNQMKNDWLVWGPIDVK